MKELDIYYINGKYNVGNYLPTIINYYDNTFNTIYSINFTHDIDQSRMNNRFYNCPIMIKYNEKGGVDDVKYYNYEEGKIKKKNI